MEALISGETLFPGNKAIQVLRLQAWRRWLCFMETNRQDTVNHLQPSKKKQNKWLFTYLELGCKNSGTWYNLSLSDLGNQEGWVLEWEITKESSTEEGNWQITSASNFKASCWGCQIDFHLTALTHIKIHLRT